jgi:uncharacterized protein (TIGR03905 family)
MKFTYKPTGICPKEFNFEINNNIIDSFEAIGGCPGNLKAIGKLIKGMETDKVISLLLGNECGTRGTSCADHIAKALISFKEKN